MHQARKFRIRDAETRDRVSSLLTTVFQITGVLWFLFSIGSSSVMASVSTASSSIEMSMTQEADEETDGERRLREAGMLLREMVEAGEITAEQARGRMQILRKRWIGDGSGDRGEKKRADGDDEETDRPRRGTKEARRIREAVEAGRITAEEGRERLRGLRRRIAEGAADSSGESRGKSRIDGAGLRKRLEAAIDEGTITWEQAKDRYIAAMERGDGGQGAKIRARLDAGIESGRITEDQAVEIYIEMREEEGQRDSEQKEAGEEKDSSQRRVTRQDYADAQAKMEKMVEAGEITREQMRKRLAGMRKMIGRPSEKEETSQRTVTRQQYADAQAKMEQMVKDGKITAEQMRQRLASMRKLIGG